MTNVLVCSLSVTCVGDSLLSLGNMNLFFWWSEFELQILYILYIISIYSVKLTKTQLELLIEFQLMCTTRLKKKTSLYF